MRCALVLLVLAGCGGTSSSTTRITTEPRADGTPAGGPVLIVAVRAFTETGRDYDLLPLACQGGPDGVHGGRACLDAVEGEPGAVRFKTGGAAVARLATAPEATNPCLDSLGAALAGFAIQDNTFLQPLDLGIWPAGASGDLQLIPTTPLAPGKPLDLDLDGDGVAEHITINAAGPRAVAGIGIVDGHDPLMTDVLEPFPDAAELTIRATTDLDADRRRELVIFASHPSGDGVAVIEYWASAEAYRLDCRDP